MPQFITRISKRVHSEWNTKPTFLDPYTLLICTLHYPPPYGRWLPFWLGKGSKGRFNRAREISLNKQWGSIRQRRGAGRESDRRVKRGTLKIQGSNHRPFWHNICHYELWTFHRGFWSRNRFQLSFTLGLHSEQYWRQMGRPSSYSTHW